MADHAARVVECADAGDRHVLWERLAGMSVAMLTTFDAEGDLHARPVQPRVENGHVWVFTAVDGGIADDVLREPRVHLSFVDHGEGLFASLSGDAYLQRDSIKARELWSTMAGVWFPDGPDDRNLGILRVDVRRGDYWDVKESRLVQFFRLATAAPTNTRPQDVGTHRRFTR